MSLRALIKYHIMTEKANRMLRKKHGLTGDDPYVFTIFEETVPLSKPFAEIVQNGLGALSNSRGLDQTVFHREQRCSEDRTHPG